MIGKVRCIAPGCSADRSYEHVDGIRANRIARDLALLEGWAMVFGGRPGDIVCQQHRKLAYGNEVKSCDD